VAFQVGNWFLRIEGDVTSEYAPEAAVRENVPDVIVSTNKP
jgi:hypothetical protein